MEGRINQMRWRIVSRAELSLGERVLRRGMQGKDVRELQTLLAESGFYFEAPDGEFGVLTQEAVRLFQKNFRLKIDGIAGPAFCQALRRLAARTGRIVYTVKKGERLDKISREFGVTPLAWQSIPRRNSIKRLYPGMKLLVYEKTLFIWESKAGKTGSRKRITGQIDSRLQVDAQGELQLPPEALKPEGYYLVTVEPEAWESCFTSKKFSHQLAESLKKLLGYQWGLDLRSAPLEAYPNWGALFQPLLKAGRLKHIPFVLFPLFLESKGANPAFWRNLETVERFAGLLMVEPLYDTTSLEAFRVAGSHLKAVMNQLSRWDAIRRMMPVVGSRGWNWEADQAVRRVSFKEIKLIRAMHARIAAATLPDGLSLLQYISRGQQQHLVYRDLADWQELLAEIVKYNFGGVVIRDFGDLGKAGPELIAGSFAVALETKKWS